MDDLDAGLLDEAEHENHFPTVYAFVREYMCEVYAFEIRAQTTEFRWCRRWWEHVEAVARLEACWKAFEAMRRDPGAGMSSWFRDHADPCMGRLTSPEGPFSRCDAEQHRIRPALPMDAPPAWLTDHPGSTVGHELAPRWTTEAPASSGGHNLSAQF